VNRDLIVVVPDKHTEQALTAILARPHALGIRPIRYAVRVHPHRDPGCYGTAHELVSTFAHEAEHALVVFDRAWDGAPSNDRVVLQGHVEEQLRADWGERGACVVIDPELEVWVWSTSPHVADALGWRGRQPDLRSWLQQSGLWPADLAKPTDPKEAFLQAVRHVRVPPSAAQFRQLGETVGLRGCVDPAFNDLLAVLRRWFGQAELTE
jgi:hypothetical protein